MISKTHRAVAIGLLLPLQSLAANVEISVSPSSSSLAPGASTIVDLVGSYDGIDNLLGGAFSLNFRADLLEVIGVTLTAPQDVAGSAGSLVIDGVNGTLSGLEFASFVGVNGTFSLATIEFRSLGLLGSSTLTAFDAESPIFGWINESFETVTVSSEPGIITVVPELETYALMLAGLGVVGWAVRRKLTACAEPAMA